MRVRLVSIVLSTLIVAFPQVALSNDDVVEQFGDWTVTMSPKSDSAVAPLCTLARPNLDFRFALSNVPSSDVSGPTRGSARMWLLLPEDLARDSSEEIEGVRVTVPDYFSWNGSKEQLTVRRGSSGLQVVVFVDPRIDTVIPALARGKKLIVEIKSGGQTGVHDYDLTGSYRALVAYENCLANVKWANPTEADDS